MYFFDTLELTPKWLLNLGLRHDDYETEQVTPSATAATVVLRNRTDFVNYQAGVVFKPTANGSVYLSYGTSSTPPGMDGGDGGDGITAAIKDLEPQDTANLELGVPLSADQVFRIGSVTKQFSAAAALKLAEAGKLSLDDPLAKFV